MRRTGVVLASEIMECVVSSLQWSARNWMSRPSTVEVTVSGRFICVAVGCLVYFIPLLISWSTRFLNDLMLRVW